MKHSFALFLLSAIVFWACEKDDICSEDTETTPRLVLKFYDNDNPNVVKSVPDILVHGIGNNAIIGELDGTVSKDSIFLPLKTDAAETTFSIYKNFAVNDNNTPDDTSDDFIEGNEDILTVSYNRNEVYVSRACGYKTIFETVTVSVQDDNDNWIVNHEPVNEDFQTVENERAAHFKIFH